MSIYGQRAVQGGEGKERGPQQRSLCKRGPREYKLYGMCRKGRTQNAGPPPNTCPRAGHKKGGGVVVGAGRAHVGQAKEDEAVTSLKRSREKLQVPVDTASGPRKKGLRCATAKCCEGAPPYLGGGSGGSPPGTRRSLPPPPRPAVRASAAAAACVIAAGVGVRKDASESSP